jgi:phenylalanyl-tRNA synthetase beta chain
MELAHVLTMAGLEVEDIQIIGLAAPQGESYGFRYSGLSWEPDKIVVARIDEVQPHPNADKLVLCRLHDGSQEHIVLTGAPNLYPYKGQGALAQPIMVAYAKEGARIYDGHQPGQVLTSLKRAKIRGVDSYSMVCSEKELGISEEHEGVIFLDPDAPTGMPLADYMGDAVLEISLNPNMVRCASILGVARELSALTGKPLHKPQPNLPQDTPAIQGKAFLEISDTSLNPRFVLGLVTGVTPQPSPYKTQLRLRLAGMRPINSVVDATNYVMLELGEPLHAFDYDVLVQRAGGKAPTISTRPAQAGEMLTTLDNVERKLDPFTVLVCDTAGSLSLAGVMGGLESEVTENTRNVLLEGAAWNLVNTRRTLQAQKLSSEAGYRFARGVHPALAEEGVKLGLRRMADWSGGQIAAGLVDAYPAPQHDPLVAITTQDVKKLLGIELSNSEMIRLLTALEFTCRMDGETILAQTPSHRLDIGEGLVGKADLMEEIARLYSYNNIPESRLAAELPPQRANPELEMEEKVRDVLASLGLQEVVTYRLTSPEREKRILPPDVMVKQAAYITLKNPIAPERSVMRHSLLASVLEVLEHNIRLRDTLELFEIGQVFLPKEGQTLPDEPRRLVIALSGQRHAPHWSGGETGTLDFFDLKGLLEALTTALHLPAVSYEPASAPSFHPGKCAALVCNGQALGVFGELHPLVKQQFDFLTAPVIAADLDLEAVLAIAEDTSATRDVPAFPPTLEDIAVVVDEDVPAGKVEALIRQTGGKLLAGVRLFDVFRSEQIGAGKKSLAYSLTYQSYEKTLTPADAAQLRGRIIRRLEQEVGAKLRS